MSVVFISLTIEYIRVNCALALIYGPTSKPKYALELGQKLGLTPNGDCMKSGLHHKEILGNIIVSDVGVTGALKTTGFGISTAGTAFALSGATVTVSGIVGVAGAVTSGAKSLKGKQYN
ncbi:MAG: hypothetical protein DIZ80_06965 [endosymbiont of Galathealinum brachiosum]|uniref:Uncharacterized protein n=1 Tax=endosymbiont of Galathealinum brachiosum TaxID=2200906 RepID=A0A370DG27_9GAMM|nr:MAG: hypothetical protein DIZ80_06965 [endosymbiont of Galathealinum brachiosum]